MFIIIHTYLISVCVIVCIVKALKGLSPQIYALQSSHLSTSAEPSLKHGNSLVSSVFSRFKILCVFSGVDCFGDWVIEVSEMNKKDSIFVNSEMNKKDSIFVKSEMNRKDSIFVKSEMNNKGSIFVESEMNNKDSIFVKEYTIVVILVFL